MPYLFTHVFAPKTGSRFLEDMLYFLQIALTQMAKVAMNRLTEMKDRTSWTRSVM